MGLRSHDYVNDNAFGSTFIHFFLFGRMCAYYTTCIRSFGEIYYGMWIYKATEGAKDKLIFGRG